MTPGRSLAAVLVGCAVLATPACSTRSSKLLEELGQLESAGTERAAGEVGLAECIARAASVGPAVSRAGVASLLDRAELDEVASRGDLSATAVLSVGSSVVGQPKDLSAWGGLQWDALRYFQDREIQRYRDSAEQNEGRMLELARKNAALETVQAFFDYAVARQREELAALALEPVRRELAVLERSASAATARRRSDLSQEAAALEHKRIAMAGVAAQRRLNLERLAHLAPQAVIVPALPAPPPLEAMDSLDAYVRSATQAAPATQRAELRREIAGELAEIARVSRYTNLVFDITWLDLFERAATPLVPPLRWSLALLDAGRHNRELLRARAEAKLASLKVDDAEHQAASAAVRAWFDLAERRMAYRQEASRVDRARMAVWAAEARADAAAQALRQRRQALREQEVELAARQQALILSHMQFELLRRPQYEEWLQASLGHAGVAP